MTELIHFLGQTKAMLICLGLLASSPVLKHVVVSCSELLFSFMKSMDDLKVLSCLCTGHHGL